MMARGNPAVECGGNKLSRHLPRSSASVCRPPAGALGNIRIIQDLLGQSDMQAAVIYAHGLSRGLHGVASLGVSL
jgi:site-specific recombinase XerD